MIWSAEWKYSSVFQPPWLKYIQPGQRAVEAACHVSWKWHVHDDVVGDKIEQSRTLRSSYFVDTFLIKTRRFVRPIRMPRGPVVLAFDWLEQTDKIGCNIFPARMTCAELWCQIVWEHFPRLCVKFKFQPWRRQLGNMFLTHNRFTRHPNRTYESPRFY